MTKDTTKAAAVSAEMLHFGDWFEAIEDGIRARVRGFIETVLEEELAPITFSQSHNRSGSSPISFMSVSASFRCPDERLCARLRPSLRGAPCMNPSSV
jgi:hypothetical protein